MKRITCVVAAILLLVFVVRGVILPIVNHAGGGSNKDAETVNVQANTAGASTGSSTKDGTASTDTAASDTDSADSGTDATVMPVTVSYTHLDVYKRQRLHYANNILALFRQKGN